MEDSTASGHEERPDAMQGFVRPLFTLLLFLAFIIASHLSPPLAKGISRAIETTTGLRTTTLQARTEAESLRGDLEILTETLTAAQTDLAAERAMSALAAEELGQAYAALRAMQSLAQSEQESHAMAIAAIEGSVADERARLARILRLQTRTIATIYAARARIKRMAVSNVGATVGESIPFVGIGVIVAGTTYEMIESCAAMDEMTELLELLDPSHATDDEDSHAEVCGMDIPTKDEILSAIKTSPRSAWEGSKRAVGGVSNWMDEIEGPDFGRVEAWFRYVF